MKKKKEVEEIEEPNLDYDESDMNDSGDDESLEDDLDFDEKSDGEAPSFEDAPVNPLAFAHQMSKESDTSKNFKELPREVKYSFFDNNDRVDVKHFSRTYRNHHYIEKIIDLRVKEDAKLHETKKNVNRIDSREELIEYFKACNRDYLINDILDLSGAEIAKLIIHVKGLKHNYFLDTIEKNKTNIKQLYDAYDFENGTPEYIDDMGNIGKIMDTSITSMGYKGNAAQHSVMTIQAVKNEDIQKVAEEKRSFGFMDAIKKRLG